MFEELFIPWLGEFREFESLHSLSQDAINLSLNQSLIIL